MLASRHTCSRVLVRNTPTTVREFHLARRVRRSQPLLGQTVLLLPCPRRTIRYYRQRSQSPVITDIICLEQGLSFKVVTLCCALEICQYLILVLRLAQIIHIAHPTKRTLVKSSYSPNILLTAWGAQNKACIRT